VTYFPNSQPTSNKKHKPFISAIIQHFGSYRERGYGKSVYFPVYRKTAYDQEMIALPPKSSFITTDVKEIVRKND